MSHKFGTQPSDPRVVRKDDPLIYQKLPPWQRELIARRWAKDQKMFWGECRTLQNAFFRHFISLCRRPAGRADGTRGSQQCLFEMELPTHQCSLEMLGLLDRHDSIRCMENKKYAVEDGKIRWVPSKTITTYYIEDAQVMSTWLRFHQREVALDLAVFGSSKGVVTRNEGLRSIVTLIPPLLIEKCQRSHQRVVLAVTCNIFTFNDRDGLEMPPSFEYTAGQRAEFRRLAITNLQGMCNLPWKVQLSRMFLKMLPPAYREDSEEGEEGEEEWEAGEEEEVPTEEEEEERGGQ